MFLTHDQDYHPTCKREANKPKGSNSNYVIKHFYENRYERNHLHCLFHCAMFVVLHVIRRVGLASCIAAILPAMRCIVFRVGSAPVTRAICWRLTRMRDSLWNSTKKNNADPSLEHATEGVTWSGPSYPCFTGAHFQNYVLRFFFRSHAAYKLTSQSAISKW